MFGFSGAEYLGKSAKGKEESEKESGGRKREESKLLSVQ